MTAGALGIEDLRYVFSQYYHYSKNFTRYLAALMANCDNDFFRSRISENLWEEGGGCEPEKRHAQLFRDFLSGGLAITEPESIEHADFTRHFVAQYLGYCMTASPMEGSAFLSLGTEAIVAQMYEIFVEGLHKAGLHDEQLDFFYIHMACDDGHAATLEGMMCSYEHVPGWFEACARAMDRALSLRESFFNNIFDALQQRRLRGVVERIQARKALAMPADELASRPCMMGGTSVYANEIPRLDIKFSVERLPFSAEVLDPRVVRIPPKKNNERHRHAHETLFYVIQGTGRVVVGDVVREVGPGDVAFVPRWVIHQTQNTGDTEMVVLAVTDFGLTGRAFLGDYESTARNRTGQEM
jgi:quercetin dioxygenase-like cupin family protein/pyrroloquinoline quinone (PQQ) biosynthesis protein C